MSHRLSLSLLGVIAPAALAAGALAHDGLNVDESLETCDIRFSANLTQDAFARFTREAGDIAVHASRGTDVLPRGGAELGIGYAASPVDQHSDAWNETFHHPNADHPLGDTIALPRIHGRLGLGGGMDLGAYFTGNPDASYRLLGIGLKRGLRNGAASGPDLAVSLDYGTLFGPDDTTVHALGSDLHASRRWRAITGYASAGVTWARADERSPLVSLETENRLTPHAAVGVNPRVWRHVRLDLRARFASVNTFEIQVGHVF